MATYCGHSNAPAEYALKEVEVVEFKLLMFAPRSHSDRQIHIAIDSVLTSLVGHVRELWLNGVVY